MVRRYVLFVLLAVSIGLVVSVSLVFAGHPAGGPSAGEQPSDTPLSGCVPNYNYTASTGNIVPGTLNIGSSCDDCVTAVSLPFSFTFYGTAYSFVGVSSNGNLQFTTTNTAFTNSCPLPDLSLGAAIMPHWDDLRTDAGTGCPTSSCGIFTSVSGSAPNRIFNIEWRTRFFSGTGGANFEVRLYEAGGQFDFVYGVVGGGGVSASVGVQNGSTLHREFSCDTSSVTTGLKVIWTRGSCGTPTRTPAPTRTPTPCTGFSTTSSIMAGDPTQPGRLKHSQLSTCAATPQCPGQSDNNGRRYDSYTFINNSGSRQCVSITLGTAGCGPLGSGDAALLEYGELGNRFMDGTAYGAAFNPSDFTLGNLCANYIADIGSSTALTNTFSFFVGSGEIFMIVLNETVPGTGCQSYNLVVSGCVQIVGTPTPTETPATCVITFTDVHPTDYFYESVSYLYCHGVISGYGDNTFRPYNNTTRGQLCKIIVLAEEWAIDTTGGPHFDDVPEGSTFYAFVETAFNRGIISGYGDGTFRPGNNVTRSQLCKIIVLAEEWAINTNGGPHFVDVPQGSTFYDFIETAYNHTIVSGYNCGTGCLEFRPGNNATRGQICKIVYSAITQP